MLTSPSLPEKKTTFDEVMALLRPLDQWLETAIPAAESAYGVELAASTYRGLQISQDDVTRLIAQEPGRSALGLATSVLSTFPIQVLPSHTRLCWLQQTFGLSQFDWAIMAIALAPELDRRYERLYAYLQDDIRCKRPTVDLCLNLLCVSASEKLTRREHFAPQSALIREGLLHLLPDPNQTEPSLLAHVVKLDPQVLQILLGTQTFDENLGVWCQWIRPKLCFSDLPFSTEITQALPSLIQTDWHLKRPLQVCFQGVDTVGKKHVAEAIAHSLNVPLIVANFAQLLQLKIDLVPAFKRLLREALFQTALIYVDGLETEQASDHELALQTCWDCLKTHPQAIILSSDRLWKNCLETGGVLSIAFPLPDFNQRRFYWQAALAAARVDIDAIAIDTLSDRFRLTADQIHTAVMTALQKQRWQKLAHGGDPGSEANPSLSATDLFATVRESSGSKLDGLCQSIQPRYRWEDLVLPPAQNVLLREICDQVKYHRLVWQSWGFDRQKPSGNGLNVMFAGSPGTGKTMAAEVIAQELELELYKIDLSQIVSKYIGETEKNLNQIFTAATNANAILLFDEADALFGKRTEIKDAHDRYANLEVSYLLQKMDEYEGLAILTTNLRANMDEAFVRRLQFIIEFPLPTEKQRYQIWQQVFPSLAPCHPDLDLHFLAATFELSGANIRNIALAAAFLAAAEHQPIAMSHITQAIRREYQKMGKILALPTRLD